ncbi:MAG: inovirus Gp2 family protein [Alcaligenaceae bacterium]|nr:MAG: inovirus Gp2 family protein [Alcaligenaceae bacterium]
MSEKFIAPVTESWSASDEALLRCVAKYEPAFAQGIGPTGQLALNRSEHLLHILPNADDFVRLVIRDLPSLPTGQDLGDGCPTEGVNGLEAHRHSIDRYLILFPSAYHFSEPLMLLGECAQDLRDHFFGIAEVSSEERFNFLIETLQKRAADINFQKRTRARERRGAGIFSTSKSFVDGMLFTHKKIQVVQVDLGYSIDVSRSIELAEAKRDFGRFLNYLRNKRVLSSNIGYIWTAGHASYRGFYFRLFMFFEEDVGLGTAALSQYVVDFWMKVAAKGRGFAFPSDDRVNPILNGATGVLACDDKIMYRKMMLALRYLAVKEMHLSMKSRNSSRMFGHSHCKRH